MAPPSTNPERPTRGQRIASAVLGVMLAGCGIACLVLVDPWEGVFAGLGLVVLGTQSLWASIKGGRSWVERIGPLP